MRNTKRIISTILTMSAVAGMMSATPASAYKAKVLSNCTESGYYMTSQKNNVRDAIGGNSIGHLDGIRVYNLDYSEIIKDKNTGLSWVKLKDVTIKETGKKSDGYICLSYCYYMGTTANLKKFVALTETPAQENFYSNSNVLDYLEEGETIYLLETGDAQLYSPQDRVWVNVCDFEEAEITESDYYISLYTDYSGLDYSCNEDAFFNENQEIIYMHFIEQGYPETSACAIAVNAYDESGCRPTAGGIDTNGLLSYGLFQWNGGRNTRLRSWCAENNYDYTDIYAQLAYLDWELENCYPTIRDTMLNPDMTAGDASYFWASRFEVCAKKYWNRRATEAESLYNSLIINREVYKADDTQEN